MDDYRLKLLLEEQLEYEKANARKTDHQDDHEIARTLQQQFNQEDLIERPSSLVYVTKKKSADDARSLIDPSWELIDPTPNIHNLFIAFNQQFFWNKLLAVCVSWSKRMTSCAGICSYQGRAGLCSITLSEPLLKLRPRKDLIETLLHEMIHAFLFVTHNNRDRDGHGPEFHKHMHRINNEVGTNISVYHSFHDEVRLYQQHWWKCNGPCQNQKPFFGMVRRATNRAPGPYDRWWAEHSRSCGGTFIKVKEPEKKGKKVNEKENSKPKSQKSVTSPSNKSDIRTFFPAVDKLNSTPKKQNGKPPNYDNTKIQNIYGFKPGAGGSLELKNGETSMNKINIPLFNGSGQVLSMSNASSATDYSAVRNHWLSKFNTKRKDPEISIIKEPPKRRKVDMSNCPVCNKEIATTDLNEHLDDCLKNPTTSASNIHFDHTLVACDICDEFISSDKIEAHSNQCLQNVSIHMDSSVSKECPICHTSLSAGLYDIHVASCVMKETDKVLNRLKDEDKNDAFSCLVCKKMIDRKELSKHLDECMSEEIFMTDKEKDEFFDDSFDNTIRSEYQIETIELNDDDGAVGGDFVTCPVCQTSIEQSLINGHLDGCLG